MCPSIRLRLAMPLSMLSYKFTIQALAYTILIVFICCLHCLVYCDMSGASGTTVYHCYIPLYIHWLTVSPLMLYVHMMCLWFIYLFYVVCLCGVHYCMILYYMLCTTLCFVAVDTGYCCFIYCMLFTYCCKFMPWSGNASCPCW